ncbi:MAG: aldehyde dehydrogenase family protein [Syntrophorhabdus sp.]|jgi:malonate-semialdehyde dehydrogenase (acetylating)/methylmalonate-semialdehyde dehydrogenase|nr:aldehyde dehydrogenase family protein [Syntrophorhabdus sp.]
MALLKEVSKNYGKLDLHINGKWVTPQTGKYFDVTNPATGRVIGKAPVAGPDDVEKAITAAHAAFGKWRNVPFRDRAKLIFNLRDTFMKHHEELARILVQDHGCTISDGRGTISRCVENIEAAGSSMYGFYKGEHVEQLANGIDCYLIHEPVGVFLIITPGNIPMHAWSSFVPYALACGCTVIVKPSRQCPVAADAMSKMIDEAGFPPGVVNLLHMGPERELNKVILSDPRVKGVGLIGSTRVSKELFEICGKYGKRSSLNGNGKNTIVIMPDGDLDQSVNYILRGCFGMSGQRCLGSDNVVVIGDNKVYKTLKEKLLPAAKALKMGYGLDESVELGPMTTSGGREQVIGFVESGLKSGAKLLLDGRKVKVKGYEDGYFLGANVFENVTTDMHIAKEEAFGPLCNLMRMGSLDETINWINSTNYGHSACIVTESGKSARKFIREVEVGNVGINAGIPQPYAFFGLGSKKDSFFGNSKSRMDSVKMFLDEKTVTLRWV